MSVIWSGVTEEGAIVPVQVTAEGKVVAVGDGPEGEYLKLTGGNLTGDLTIGGTLPASPNISLNASNGLIVSGTYGKAAGTEGGYLWQGSGFGSQLSLYSNTTSNFAILVATAPDSTTVKTEKFTVQNDGELRIGNNTKDGSIAGNINIRLYNSGASEFVGDMAIGGTLPAAPNILLNADGSADFAGDVIIGSRGEQWLIRESNGVAMLVQQTLRGEQPIMESLRDLPNELDLIEAALNEVMYKLRMTPPAGWPVWDGQSEVTTDNHNA